MKKALFILFVLANYLSIAQPKRPVEPADIYRLQDVDDPQVSPDGKWVAYVVSSVDTAKDERNDDIWMVSWDGKETIQLTNSKDDESAPRWSTDGRYLSFLSDRKAGKDDDDDKRVSQLWLLDMRGGEGKKISDVKGSIDDYAWSPDAKKVLLVMKDADYSDTAKDKARDPFVMDRYHFKQDIEGYLSNRKKHLYLLDVASFKTDTLTNGVYDETSPRWSPDGKQIVFVSNRTAEPDKNENNDLWLMDVKPYATPKQLTTWQGDDNEPSFSPDGKSIAYIQSTSNENFTMYGQGGLVIIPKEGGQPKLLSAAIDRPVTNPRWSKDGKSVFALMEDDREQQIVQFTIANAQMKKLAGGERAFTSLELNTANGNWLTSVSDPYTPYELYAFENGNTRRLTHVTDSFLAPLSLPVIKGFKSTSKDGTVISGVLYRPATADTTQKLPLILFIHGGPVGQDDYSFDFSRDVLAAGGYAVAAVNYRGSSGKGVDFIKAIYGDWGNKEVADIIGAADYLIEKGIADSSRMGIAGWSYGGILTDYTIATDQRFKAASSGAGSALQLTMYGVDQYVTQYETELGAPWKNMDKWIKLSYPFFHVDRIKTPTLFMASEKDFNVPAAGAEQMYQALRSTGVPAKLVIYPGQFHGITVPTYQVDRLQRYLDWFGQYLKK